MSRSAIATTGEQARDSRPALLRAEAVLQSVFGYHAFRSHQAGIIAALIEGRDVLALMPTGGGKSLCYQIPSLVRAGTGIVVSPLIALMQDQVDALREVGVRAAFLNSTLGPDEQRQTERALVDGGLDLLYVAPERLMTERMLSLLRSSELALFAIDEAHCVSQWGHDFRPEYRGLSALADLFPHVPRIALTATAEPHTRDEIVQQLRLEHAERFVASFDRPNIRYLIVGASETSPREGLWRFLAREHPRDAGIVYCLSRKQVEETAEWLNRKGRDAMPYHAGLDAETRRRHQQRFLREEGVIVVATIAFGMGIDKPDVRFVAHLSLPKSIEAYYQETGRAGRDGEPADAWMAFGLRDVAMLRQWIVQSEAGEERKRIEHQKLEALLGLTETTTCRRQPLIGYFGERMEEPCGNCDNCLAPPETVDGTEAARMALSAIYRTGERFGANYVVGVLTGEADPRMAALGHDRLAVYGLGKDLAASDWKSMLRQLAVQGLITVDLESHGALRLDPSCRPLLRGEARFQRRRPVASAEAPRSRDGTGRRKTEFSRDQQPLATALRELRRQIAEAANVPPYVIFHDRTLAELVDQRPRSHGELYGITGFGEKKVERYGAAVLDVITVHSGPRAAPKPLRAAGR